MLRPRATMRRWLWLALVLPLLLLAGGVPGRAMAAPANPVAAALSGHAASGHAAAASASAASASGLTAADATQLLSVLNDPVKRATLITTLTNLVKMEKAAPAAPAGLVPNSLGAQALAAMALLGTSFAVQAHDITRTLHDFRNLGTWASDIVDNPGRREIVTAALIRLAVVLTVAIAVAIGVVRRLIRRPIEMLARLGAAAKPIPPLDAGDLEADETVDAEDAEDGVLTDGGLIIAATTEATPVAVSVVEAPAPGEATTPPVVAPPEEHGGRQERNLIRMVYALRRVPLALLRFVLELMPVAAFVGVAYAFEITGFVTLGESLFVVRAALNSFVVAGIFVAVVMTLFSPRHPGLRLILVTDPIARRATFWLRMIAISSAYGFAALSVLQTLGLAPYTGAALAKILIFVEHTLLAILILRTRQAVARRLMPPRRVRGTGRVILVRAAQRWWVVAIFFDYAFYLVYAAELRNGYSKLLHFTIVTFLVLVAARLFSVALLGGLERLLRVPPAGAEGAAEAGGRTWLATRGSRYRPVFRRVLATVLILATLVTLLQLWGFHAFLWFRAGAFGGRVVSAMVSILVITLVAIVVWEAANSALERHIDALARDTAGGSARVARVRTLAPILRIFLLTLIATVVVLTVLSEVGVDIAPLLGGAGILGVAIGFGSQKLVQDFITGLFLLLENTMQVGETVTLGGLSGTVEHLSIRAIRLRAGDGSLHTIPFSSVTTVTNTNRGFGNAAVSVDIAADEDTDRAADALRGIARDMRGDPAYENGMLSDLQYWGVNGVTGQAVTLAGQIVCTDTARWGVQREFNRRMRMRFAELGIRLATPVQAVRLQHADALEEAGSREPAPAADEAEGRPATVTESPAPSALGHGA